MGMLEDDLVQAAQSGNVEEIRRLLAGGADVNAKGDPGGGWSPETPLNAALSANSWAAAAELVRNGAEEDLDCKDWDDPPVIMTAVLNNQVDLVRAMLEQDWAANITGGRYKHTPLMCAAMHGHTEIMRLLLDACARQSRKGCIFDINADDSWGHTALWHASYNYDPEPVRILLQAGADPNGRSSDAFEGQRFHSPLANARATRTVKLLVEAGAEVDAPDYDDLTPLCHAIEHNEPNAARALISCGADVNWGNGKPMRIAARKNAHQSIFRMLADSGVKPGDEHLRIAAGKGHLAALQTLWKLGARSARALDKAAAAGSLECMDFLLDHGAGNVVAAACSAARAGNPHALFYLQGKYRELLLGAPLLHAALRGRQFGLAEDILAGGADPNGKDKSLDTPLACLLSRDHCALMRRSLHTKGMDVYNTEWPELEEPVLAMAKMLVERGADPDIPGALGRTPLWLAARHSWERTQKYLASLNVDPNRGDRYGVRPIHAAALSKRWDSVNNILDAGADINAVDKKGNTALALVAGKKPNFTGDYDSSITALIKRGADRNIKNRKGLAPIEIAASIGRGEEFADALRWGDKAAAWARESARDGEI